MKACQKCIRGGLSRWNSNFGCDDSHFCRMILPLAFTLARFANRSGFAFNGSFALCNVAFAFGGTTLRLLRTRSPGTARPCLGTTTNRRTARWLFSTFFFHGDFGWRSINNGLRPGAIHHIFNRLVFRTLGRRIGIIVRLLFALAFRVFTLFTLKPLLYLRLRSGNDAIVMFSVLKVVFSHDGIAGTIGITGHGGIFVGNMLSSAADFDIGTIAVIGARKRITAFSAIIAIVAAIIAAATATALILLSRPHTSLT